MFVYIIYSLFKGSHDLQGIIVWNTSDNVLCLQFKLVHGKQITKLHLDMRNEDKHYNLIVSDYICHLIDMTISIVTIKLYLLNLSVIYLLVITGYYMYVMES